MKLCERCDQDEPEQGSEWCAACKTAIFSEPDMPRFQKSELVQAFRIKAINANGWITPDKPNTEPFYPGADFHRRYKPKVGGAYLFYSDGRRGYEEP